MNPVKGLLRSRKFLLAGLGVVQTLVANYLDMPQDVWLSINALLLAVIGSIAWEDAAQKKSAPMQVNTTEVNE